MEHHCLQQDMYIFKLQRVHVPASYVSLPLCIYVPWVPNNPWKIQVLATEKKNMTNSSYKNLPGKLVHVFFFLPSRLHFFPLRSPYQGQLHWNQLPPETELWSNLEPRFRGNGVVFGLDFFTCTIPSILGTVCNIYLHFYYQNSNQTQVNIPIYTIHGMGIDIQLWYFLSVCFHVANKGRMYLNWRPTSKQ